MRRGVAPGAPRTGRQVQAEEPDQSPARPGAPGSGALAMSGVVKRYPDARLGDVPVLDEVCLTVEEGELVAIYGPSGSGKTTLLMIAAGLLRADAGVVSFGGQALSGMSERELALYRRQQLGFVFQSFHLIPGASALENAATKLLSDGATLREACEAARPWLQRLGLGEVADKPGDRLSMGERQRVAIARALVNEPSLLLADEPTGSLDRERGRQTLAMLRQIASERGIPLLLVTHDPEVGAFADRVHTLKDGRLTEGLCIDLAPLSP